MGSRSEESLERLLEEKIRELDEQISHWKSVRKTLDNHRRNLRTLRTMDLSEIRTIEREARQLVTVDIGPDVSFDKQVEMITGETKKYQLRRLRDASYGIRSPADAVCGPFTRARGMRCPGSTGRFWTSRQGTA